MAETSYTVRADVRKNRLYITFVGFFSDDYMREACDRVIAEAGSLRPGFSIITDISQCKPATQRGAETIRRTQEHLAAHGVGRVVRVVAPDNVIIKFQFQRRGQGYYKADTANSLAEAERMLDEKK